MFNRLAKVLRLASDRLYHGTKNRNRKNGEHRLSVEMLEPRMLLAATVFGQAVLSQTVVSQDYTPAAVVAAPADFDNDGDVDGNDLAQWEDNFGADANADADSDGDTDGADFLAWQRQFTGSLYTLFSDDFSNDTIVNYTTQTTDGAGGSLLYDATNQRAQVTTGDNNGMMFSQGVTATDSGTFSIDFNPTMLHPAGGVLQVRLRQDANNYYEISNTDGYAVGAIRKFVNNVEEDIASFTSNYSQNNNYTITVDFSPTETTVTAFDDVLMINTDGTAINVNSFEANSYQQDSFFDNISLTSGSVAPDTEKPSPPTGLGATAVSSSQIDLAWTASTDNVGVTRYTVYRNGVQIPTNVVTTSYQDTGLAGSTTYSYTVKAFDAAGNTSSQSTAAMATTLAGSGTTYYVGPDSVPGIDFTTIQAAADVVQPGDTVIVKDGVYNNINAGNLTSTWQMKKAGTLNNWITFKAENQWGAVLDGGNNAIDFGINFSPNVSYVRIEGFEIKGYKFGGISINQENTHHIKILRNHVHHIGNWNSTWAGLDAIETFAGDRTDPSDSNSPRIDNWSEYVTIDSNLIHDIGKLETSNAPFNHDHGIYLRGQNNTATNNIIYNINAGYAFKVAGFGENDHFNKVINNTIIADNYDDYAFWGGIWLLSSSNWIENNIIIVPEGKENIGGAIKIKDLGAPETNLHINNNLTNAANTWAHAACSTSNCDDGISASGNKVGADPLFTGAILPSAVTADYKLQSGSPAIDTGLATNAPSTDFDDNGRPVDGDGVGGAQHDIGAFEFVPPAPLLAPPEGEEASEVSPAVQGELFDVALDELIGSSRDDASIRSQYSTPSPLRTFDLKPSAELAEQFATNHRTGPAAPALRLSGENSRGLEPTAQDREEIFDSLFTEFDEALIR